MNGVAETAESFGKRMNGTMYKCNFSKINGTFHSQKQLTEAPEDTELRLCMSAYRSIKAPNLRLRVRASL